MNIITRTIIITLMGLALFLEFSTSDAAYIKKGENSDSNAGVYVQPHKAEEPVSPPAPSQQQLSAPNALEEPKAVPTTKDNYFSKCMSGKNPMLTGELLEMFCACTAAKKSTAMTPEQIEVMRHDTPEGQRQRNRMVLEVYTPCIEFPTEGMIRYSCNQQASKLRNPEGTCGCAGREVGQYMKAHAPQVIKEALAKNPKNVDPLSTLVESPEFNKQAQASMQSCALKHELLQ